EAARYMYGHGFGMLFLASVYGEEEDGDRRKKLEGILTRAVDFTGKAQTPRGGWGYLSSPDGGGVGERSRTHHPPPATRAPTHPPAAGTPRRAQARHRRAKDHHRKITGLSKKQHSQPRRRILPPRPRGPPARRGRPPASDRRRHRLLL